MAARSLRRRRGRLHALHASPPRGLPSSASPCAWAACETTKNPRTRSAGASASTYPSSPKGAIWSTDTPAVWASRRWATTDARASRKGAARRQGPLHRLPAHTPCGHRQRGVPAPCRTALHGRVPRPEGTSAPLRTPRCQGLYLRAARRPHRLDLHSLHPFGTQLAAERTAARGAPLRHAVLQQGVGSAGASAHLPPRGAARGAVSSAAPRRSDGQGPLRAAGLQPRRRSPPPASRDDGAR